jgi:hypothetical protein
MNVRQFLNKPFFSAIIVCPLLLTLILGTNFNKPQLFKSVEYQLTPQFFKFVSSGFWPAASDLLWLQTLQMIGNANYSPETLAESLGFYRLMTSLDPDFYEGYDQGALVFSFFYDAAYPSLEILDKGIRHYESGRAPKRFWTHPYSLYLHRAYVNAFLRNNWEAAKRDYLSAGDMANSPAYIKQMRFWLEKEGSEKRLAHNVLKLLIQNTTDKVIKAKYEEKLKAYE